MDFQLNHLYNIIQYNKYYVLMLIFVNLKKLKCIHIAIYKYLSYNLFNTRNFND